MVKRIVLVLLVFIATNVDAQNELGQLNFSKDSLAIIGFLNTSLQPMTGTPGNVPIVSYVLNDKEFHSSSTAMQVRVRSYSGGEEGIKAVVTFTNTSNDTVQLKNVVPFGPGKDRLYITGLGTHGLSRTHLFIPGRLPVNVIVPDNAWDLGYCSFSSGEHQQLGGLVRRDRASIKKGTRSRFETTLYPGGSVDYKFYAESVKGDWRNMLRHVFQKRMLYDVDHFDNSLFERPDLKWIRHTYVHHLMMAWDKFFYDIKDRRYHLEDFLKRGQKLYGGDDVVSVWPTWPTLGLDQRNQFDLFRDLPGGTKKISSLASMSRKMNTKFFICYNPWDESTRSEDHFRGLSDLIKETSADGVILDTRGGSSNELQEAADRVRKGVIMYSEGMAIPSDMQGIVSGRVHNALYYPPMLNLNKLIKPSFTIYRVAELKKERILREFNTSFFNGYGTEINIMSPGQPEYADEQYRYLGKTTMILRENTYNFISDNYVPLIATTSDSIWVNEWPLQQKTIYTVYSIKPGGYKGKLFEVTPHQAFHFVDLWNHQLLEPQNVGGKWMIEAETESFNQKYLGTNNEGAVTAIAKLPVLLHVSRSGDQLQVSSKTSGDQIRIWAGHPSYEKTPVILKPGDHSISLSAKFGRFEGDFVIQLMEDGILLDETIVTIDPGDARRISTVEFTKGVAQPPQGMVPIPGGKFYFKTTHGDEFISYPVEDTGRHFAMKSFFMDKFPVTNIQFQRFLKDAGYRPSDTSNFLKHWDKGKIPAGQENFPVVYVSYEDAQAFAKWAGKRLPTEIEWQYAAQTSERNEWPWKQETPVTRKLQEVNSTLTVSSLEGIDSSRANLGDGKLYAVGKYPAGANPFGLQDLVGSVWQLTNDVYMSGSYRYIMMKGGSYFKPSSSWWYVQGGPRELHYRQMLLRVSEGFERNATVGFRCAKEQSGVESR